MLSFLTLLGEGCCTTGQMRSAKSRFFKAFKNPDRPPDIYYYSNQKSWMTADITTYIFAKINPKMDVTLRKAMLFMDNTPRHPQSITD